MRFGHLRSRDDEDYYRDEELMIDPEKASPVERSILGVIAGAKAYARAAQPENEEELK